MALEISLFCVIVQDMQKSLEFYRRLGLAIPEGSEENTRESKKGIPHVYPFTYCAPHISF